MTYRNEPWHRECFTCTNCTTPLAGQRFTSRDEKPYCADCFGELFAKRCTACTKPITGEFPTDPAVWLYGRLQKICTVELQYIILLYSTSCSDYKKGVAWGTSWIPTQKATNSTLHERLGTAANLTNFLPNLGYVGSSYRLSNSVCLLGWQQSLDSKLPTH